MAGYSPIVAGLAFLPVTLPNFAAAMAIPRLTSRYGNPTVLVAGLAVSVLGMAWLSRLGPDTPYLTGIALPMVLIGIGQGGALGPLTAGGPTGVAPRDAGSAGGVTNVAHQIGGSLGLAVLVAVFAAADSGALHDGALLAHRISAALTAGAVLLALALAVALAVRPHRRKRVAGQKAHEGLTRGDLPRATRVPRRRPGGRELLGRLVSRPGLGDVRAVESDSAVETDHASGAAGDVVRSDHGRRARLALHLGQPRPGRQRAAGQSLRDWKDAEDRSIPAA